MNIIKYVVLVFVLWISMPAMQAQEGTISQKTKRIELQKEQIIAEEKEALHVKVESINERLENKEITREVANRLKQEAEKKHALNIENRIAILENERAWNTRNVSTDKQDRSISKVEKISEKEERHRVHHRTSTHLVLAAGFNNAMEEGQSLDDLDFELAGSRFFEIGMAWRTRVFQNSNFLRINYGFSFQFNGLKPTNNRYFVEEGELTTLETYPIELNKSKFRMDNFVVPVHFEFGPSRRVDSESRSWFSTANKLRLGVGGYAGFNIGERQKLKYKENGDRVKRKITGDHNTNDLVYGLSGYLGWGSTSLYAKYDLNPIFDSPNPELHNVSLGLRFTID